MGGIDDMQHLILDQIYAIKNKGLFIPSYDYIGIDKSGSLTNIYTFKLGGSGGTTVAILTLTYSDSTKTVLESVYKT